MNHDCLDVTSRPDHPIWSSTFKIDGDGVIWITHDLGVIARLAGA